jgi:hypothetical protein
VRRLIGWAGFHREADERVVFLAESAETVMSEAARRAHPCETGGILVGVWVDGSPWVVFACEVPSRASGPSHYVLPAGLTRSLVTEIQGGDSRVGYLGDWHTHPADVPASDLDGKTARKVVQDADSDSGDVVLLVARRRGRQYVLDAHLANHRDVCPVPIIRTGGLPKLQGSD